MQPEGHAEITDREALMLYMWEGDNELEDDYKGPPSVLLNDNEKDTFVEAVQIQLDGHTQANNLDRILVDAAQVRDIYVGWRYDPKELMTLTFKAIPMDVELLAETRSSEDPIMFNVLSAEKASIMEGEALKRHLQDYTWEYMIGCTGDYGSGKVDSFEQAFEVIESALRWHRPDTAQEAVDYNKGVWDEFVKKAQGKQLLALGIVSTDGVLAY